MDKRELAYYRVHQAILSVILVAHVVTLVFVSINY